MEEALLVLARPGGGFAAIMLWWLKAGGCWP